MGASIAQQPATTEQQATKAAAERVYQEGVQLYRQGTVESLRGAIVKLEEARSLYRVVGDKAGEAYSLLGIGKIYNDLGEKQKALEFFNQSLPLSRALGNKAGEAATLNNIGAVYNDLGEKQKALEFYNQSLPLSRAIGNRALEAATLNNIGGVYNDLGEKQKALEFFNQSLPLSRAVGNRAGEARTLNNIGGIYNDLGEKQKALEFFNQSLPLRREVGDKTGEARTLTSIGSVYNALGEKQKALEYYNQSLPLFRAVGDKTGEARTLTSIGSVYDDLGEKQKALEFFNQSLPLSRAVGDKTGEAVTLFNFAYLERNRGNLNAALTNIESAIAIIEDLRTKIASQQLRTSYFATVQGYYQFYIDLLMQLHLTNPAKGYDALALHISERSKARSLLELLAEANAEIRSGADPQLREIERNLQQQLNAAEQNRIKLVQGSYTEKQLTDIKQQIASLVTQLDQVQAEIRVKSPTYAAISQPGAFTLTLPQIQQQVVDENTLLLTYSLGKERSYLWAVTKTGFTSYELPKRADIEAAANEFRIVLSDVSADESEIVTTGAKLSQLILAPVANQLGNKRLLIVADGILQYIPFAALPVGASTQISVSPSARQGISVSLPTSKGLSVSPSARQGLKSLSNSESPLKRTEKQLPADSLVPLVPRFYLGMQSQRQSLASMLPLAEPPAIHSPAEPGNEGLKFPVGFNRLKLLDGDLNPRLDEGSAQKPKLDVRVSNTNPSALYTPLLVNHEIVILPSASTLAVLRNQVKSRPQTAKTLAVIADPVFNRNDPRFQTAQNQQQAATDSISAVMRACETLKRLEFSGKEADNILALVPAAKRFAALGFNASRTTATHPDLSQYQIVHFATHGCVNEEHPELSGVALSQFDSTGATTDGFLRLHDIFNLNLSAELVVLSACKTGIGRNVQGEGLIGLTRGFMYAGAKRVVVSLWNVNDAGTSQLMQKYYQLMLQKGLNPVAAMRAAQLEMWRSEKWKAPFYWAAFTVQGEWREN